VCMTPWDENALSIST